MNDYQSYKTETLTVERRDQVAKVTFKNRPKGSQAVFQWDFGAAVNDLRDDNSVRIIVLQGSGGSFRTPGRVEESAHSNKDWGKDRTNPGWAWTVYTGILRCHQAMAAIEKPIIAKVNGDAIGFGSSIAFANDFIIAQEDAVFMDHHMGGTFTTYFDGKKAEGGHTASNVPGDRGCSLVPLYMTPCKAKEYLMLCQTYTGAELARMGLINYAVTASELDSKVDDIVKRLLAKGAYALARTKRLLNKRIVAEINRTLDAGVAYEMANWLQPLDIKTLG